MDYDKELWEKYTDENVGIIQDDQSKFIYFLSVAIGAKKICEVGCNIGNNLSDFPKDSQVYGIDMSEYALEKAKNRYPSFKFKVANMNKIPFENSYFDLVFTRGVLIHIPSSEIDAGLKEMVRVSKKWIMNLEYFGKDGEMIEWSRGDELLWYRNMKERWNNFDVDIISDVEIPLEIDQGKVRLTLVKKKNSQDS